MSFLIMITISLSYCCEKVFIFMDIWTTGKNLIKITTWKIKDLYSHLNMEDITDADYAHTKIVRKDPEIKI